MKTFALLALLGVISAETQPENRELIRLNTSAYENAANKSDSDSSSSDSDEDLVQLSSEGPCVYLDETTDELDYQVDMFSRTFDPRHWTNAKNIAGKLGGKADGHLKVHAWELYDKAFTFPRVRRYNFVNDNMDMLEHFQDNLNTNISNNVNMERFLRAATTVRTNISTKYHNGEFDDPANTDPKDAPKAGKYDYPGSRQ